MGTERQRELKRRYHRKTKMPKLKAKLAEAKDEAEREKLLYKIKRLSPFWEPQPEEQKQT